MPDSYEPMWQEPDNKPNSPTPRPDTTPQVGLLRWVAIIGTGVVFLWRATSLSRMQPRQDWGIVVVVLAVLAVGLTCLVLMPVATGRLRRHMDLLLPFGLYTVAEALLEGLAAIPVISSLLTPSWSLKILSLSFSLSLVFLLGIALAVLYAGWTTALILQAVRQNHVDSIRGFTGEPNWFWRVLGAEALGWTVLFAMLAIAITVGVVVLPLALIAIAVFGLVWNLMTAALLPVVVAERKPFGESVRKGIRVSWEGKSRWWLPVVAQMVLLGWITFFSVSYTSNPRPGSFSTQNKTDFSVNAFWTGGYANECQWHTKLMKAVEAEPLPLAEFLLGVVFAVLAIVVKLEITSRVYPLTEIAEDEPNPANYEPPQPM
jgi:hypothetical protein